MEKSHKKQSQKLKFIIILMLIVFPFLSMIESHARFFIIKQNITRILSKDENQQISLLNELIKHRTFELYIYKNTKSRVLISTVEASSVANAYEVVEGNQLATKQIFEVSTDDNMYTIFLGVYFQSLIWVYMVYGSMIFILFIRYLKLIKVVSTVPKATLSSLFDLVDQELTKKYLAYMDLTIDDIRKIMHHLHQPFDQKDLIRLVNYSDFKLVQVKDHVQELGTLVQDVEELSLVNLNHVCLIIMTSFQASQVEPPKYRLYANKQYEIHANHSMIQRLIFILVHINQYKVNPMQPCEIEIRCEENNVQFLIKSYKSLDNFHELDWVDHMINDRINHEFDHDLSHMILALSELKQYFNASCSFNIHFDVFEMMFLFESSSNLP